MTSTIGFVRLAVFRQRETLHATPKEGGKERISLEEGRTVTFSATFDLTMRRLRMRTRGLDTSPPLLCTQHAQAMSTQGTIVNQSPWD